jgi:hypothetical protein
MNIKIVVTSIALLTGVSGETRHTSTQTVPANNTMYNAVILTKIVNHADLFRVRSYSP